MKLSIERWIIVVLLVVITLIIIFYPDKPTKEEVKQARDSIKQITALNTVLSKRAESIAKELTLEKEKAKVSEKRFNEEIQKPKTITRILRPQIQPIADSIPVLREFIAAQDEVIEIQSARVDTLTSEKAFQAKLYEDLIVLKDSLLTGKDQIIQQQTVIIVTQEKELRKSRRREKLSKIFIPVVAGLAFVLGSAL